MRIYLWDYQAQCVTIQNSLLHFIYLPIVCVRMCTWVCVCICTGAVDTVVCMWRVEDNLAVSFPSVALGVMLRCSGSGASAVHQMSSHADHECDCIHVCKPSFIYSASSSLLHLHLTFELGVEQLRENLNSLCILLLWSKVKVTCLHPSFIIRKHASPTLFLSQNGLLRLAM